MQKPAPATLDTWKPLKASVRSGSRSISRRSVEQSGEAIGKPAPSVDLDGSIVA
jgi:hypothetical protein